MPRTTASAWVPSCSITSRTARPPAASSSPVTNCSGIRRRPARSVSPAEGAVPAGGEVGGADGERAFHHPGPVVYAGFEVAGRGGHAERGQPVVQAGDGAPAEGRRGVRPWVTRPPAPGGARGPGPGGAATHGVAAPSA